MRTCGADATITGLSGAMAAGMSINGCVFSICTPGRAGGSGKAVIRAVSFFGLLASAGEVMDKGIAAAALDPVVVADGRGAAASGLGAACAGVVGGETGGTTSAGVAVGCGGRVMRPVSFFGS